MVLQTPDAVAAYKSILAAVIDRRPSGTRQRLAAALAKNRSFVSQITNPSYAVPIPAAHLDAIFEICRFSAAEKRDFLTAYQAAHPRRMVQAANPQRARPPTQLLPDLGDAGRNARLQALVSDFVRQIALLIQEEKRR
ncbi:MAG TPA: hypothetical protein VL101_13840 [Nordella sp.]|nr:hypothetical protein [Nordella sp.]